MPSYTLRDTKGSALSFAELDNNYIASQAASRFPTACIFTPPSSYFINQAMCGSAALTTGNSIADYILLTPFQVPYDLTIDQVGVWQTSAGSISLRVLIYTSDADGRPSSKDAETATITTAQNSNTISLSHTFNANTLYWVGTHTSGAETFRKIDDRCLLSWSTGGATALNTTGYATSLELTSTSVGSAPTNWSFASSQYTSNTPISIGFRAA